ncbi:MAG TPA: hypothetical protein VK454_12815 [Myxococcaceae bacterium]|nr:hypothetical protein [Myxococcaceae bacterium]
MRTTLLRLVATALLVAGCAPDIPQPCLVGRADSSAYVATLSLKSGQDIAPECAAATPPQRVELYGVEKYSPPGQASTVAMLPLDLDQNPVFPGDTPPLSEGAFSAENANAEGLCTVPSLSLEQGDVPDGSGGSRVVSYQFSDLRFLAGPAYQGTQFSASLHYADGACGADYDVLAVWPAVGCATSDDCNPAQDISQGIFGSGINSAYPVVCDPVAQYCVLTGTTFPQTSGFVP